MTLDDSIQLHESLCINYYVDHYAAELYTEDGQRLILMGVGEDVEGALQHLTKQLAEIESLVVLRSLPELDFFSIFYDRPS